jgi:hypothetical protein
VGFKSGCNFQHFVLVCPLMPQPEQNPPLYGVVVLPSLQSFLKWPALPHLKHVAVVSTTLEGKLALAALTFSSGFSSRLRKPIVAFSSSKLISLCSEVLNTNRSVGGAPNRSASLRTKVFSSLSRMLYQY